MDYVIILGKAGTSKECPFDADEVWGVNNVPTHPDFCGSLSGIKILDKGQGYTKAEISFEGDGEGIEGHIIVNNGSVETINVTGIGKGFTSPPKVIINGDGQGAMAEVTVFPLRKFHKLFAFDLLDDWYIKSMKPFAPIMSWQEYADIKYPLEEIIKTFNTRYFTNTVSYMIAYAAYLKIPKLAIYGVDTAFGAPYAQENRGVEYWIGRAEERGIEVYVPDASQLKRTVSGVMYGERDHCNAMLYLHERINLINTLPQQGSYSDALKSQNAWWVLMPKEDEAKAHGVVINKLPQGGMNFSCPQEYLADIQMPPETWEYLRNILVNLEKDGKLPFPVITAYEKLILANPMGGN